MPGRDLPATDPEALPAFHHAPAARQDHLRAATPSRDIRLATVLPGDARERFRRGPAPGGPNRGSAPAGTGPADSPRPDPGRLEDVATPVGRKPVASRPPRRHLRRRHRHHRRRKHRSPIKARRGNARIDLPPGTQTHRRARGSETSISRLISAP